MVDAYGCAPGNDSQSSDAIQAFCQASMLSKVWVSLLLEAVFKQDSYYAVKDPVLLLFLALYGYPDSPSYWEMDCDKKVVRTRHPELRLLLSIYVDDFKMAGPKENLAKGWALLREEIDMEDPATPTLYLRCEQATHDITMPSGAKVRMMVYDMETSYQAV